MKVNVEVNVPVKVQCNYTINQLNLGCLYKIVVCGNQKYLGRYVFKPNKFTCDVGLQNNEAIVIGSCKTDDFLYNLCSVSFSDTDRFVITDDVLNITLNN